MIWNSATRWIAVKLNGLSSQIPPPPRDPRKKGRRKILLVQAHPCEDSFSAAIADAVERGAAEGGHHLKRRNLYQEGFQPALTSKEREVYFDVEKGLSRIPDHAVGCLRDLQWCDTFVVVYPTWWFNMPAMLKGFFDRVLIAGTDGAWDLPTQSASVTNATGLIPRLTNVQQIMGVSTYGAPQIITLLAGDNGRNTIASAIRPIFSSDCTCRWLALYGMDSSTLEQRECFLEEVTRVTRDEL